MSLSIIVAVASNGVIGGDNKLLWHLPDDLQWFKKCTMGRPIIMGRKTFESLPKVLPGRIHFVLSKNTGYKAPEGVKLFSDVDILLQSLPEGENFIIGGANIYKLLFDYADKMYITKLGISYDGDAYFPTFDEKQWTLVESTKGIGDIPHQFMVYHKNKIEDI